MRAEGQYDDAMRIDHLTVLLLALSLPVSSSPQEDEEERDRIGHSSHGSAFDEGPRQRPWKLDDIGSTHFPITTSVPEVQEWFDQGNTLLHSFWYWEAERSFRWCLKLDPECAMAWWGLARAVGERGGNDRSRDVLREAILRKDAVTDRERMYIEAWEDAYLPEMSGAVEILDEEDRSAFDELAERLEKIVLAYPDDIEAKSLLALYSLDESRRYGNELILQQVLEREPLHPGAHHYRIHNWDGEDGAYALDSCEVYGQLAKYVGHANHMPGHIYSGIGMWHEAAIWMDRATRVEKHYMREQMIFPFNHWNYAHNRNYLSYIQGSLGMVDAALDGARQLLAAPLDPKFNDGTTASFSVHNQGRTALLRELVRFEHWDELLDPETIEWRDLLADDVWKAYCEGVAHLGRGETTDAIDSLLALKKLEERVEEGGRFMKGSYELMMLELRGLVALERGDDLKGVSLLAEGAEKQLDPYYNDPPSYPRVLATLLGDAHLARHSPELASEAYERTLEKVPNDPFALSGLARARHALGDIDGAERAYGRLLFQWSDADPGLRWLDDARALGLTSEPVDESPKPQRRYAEQVLAEIGPQTWAPYPAPELDAIDGVGDQVTLDEYVGRLVLLVFFLGEECPHCVDQLVAIDEKIDEFTERDVDVLAISGDTPEMIEQSETMGELGFRLLSDEGFANAKRFRSYDDFEEIELHSTILIDRDGLVRWARSGGDPFTDLEFLFGEIDRVDAGPDRVGALGSAPVEAGSGTR